MKIKKSLLKESVKNIVRQCLFERSLKEHYKQIREEAKKNNLREYLDNLIRHVLQNAPAIANDPLKVAKVVAEMFEKQSKKKIDPEKLLPFVKYNMGDSGETSKNAINESKKRKKDKKKNEEEYNYDENEEIELINLMAHISKKLQDMHGKKYKQGSPKGFEVVMAGGTEFPGGFPFGRGEEFLSPFINEANKRRGAQYKKQSPRQARIQKDDHAREVQVDPELTEINNKENKEEIVYYVPKKGFGVNEKVNGRAFKTPPSYTGYQEVPISELPIGTEIFNSPSDVGIGQHPTADRNYPYGKVIFRRVTKHGIETIRTGQKNETGNMKENHRVQTRSYVTVNDNPNDPNVMRDPENPYSNGA